MASETFHKLIILLLHDVSEQLRICVQEKGITELLQQFETHMSKVKNFAYWHTYLRMVEILLAFITAQRTGNWELHVEAFASMLPWLSVYDHTNYARWGPVYLSDMKSLEKDAPDVYREFMAGNFVVKRSNNFFNEVPADQATEWMNRVCKTAGGIIGITRQDQARDRFCITWAHRSYISDKTMEILGLQDDEKETSSNRTDSQPARVKSEESKVKELMQQMGSLDVYGLSAYDKRGEAREATQTGNLVSIATKDVATDEICDSLLSAESRGRDLVEDFTKARLVDRKTDFFSPIKKTKSKTFAYLYKTPVSEKQKAAKLIRADRKLLQRLFNAANSGRTVQTAEVLQHELSPVPLSLADANGKMNHTTKSQILDVLTKGNQIATPQNVPESSTPTCVIIDGHSLIQSMGKPKDCLTFGEYGDLFVKSVYKNFTDVSTRVDVTFDRYLGGNSIKAATRIDRIAKHRPIRKEITNRDVPLPQVWEQYISHNDNKADLAEFLSGELMHHSDTLPESSTIVVGGGSMGEVNATANTFGAKGLSVQHEEADTRMIVHGKDAYERGYKRLLVNCRDTDVLLLLIYHMGTSVETWMVSGTAKQRKCYPVHTIAQSLGRDVRQNILSFHALTGCDTTSSFSGISKKATWNMFLQYPDLVQGFVNRRIRKYDEIS